MPFNPQDQPLGATLPPGTYREPMDFFKLFFTVELIDVSRTTNYSLGVSYHIVPNKHTLQGRFLLSASESQDFPHRVRF